MTSVTRGAALRLRSLLASRVDGASVAVFRFAFGLVVAYEVLGFFRKGWIAEFWIYPSVRFFYLGFEWVKPLPEPWIHALIALLGVAAVALAVGLLHRIAAWCVFIIFTYQFLLEATRYLNHYYAMCLIAFLLCFIPSANSWSLDRAFRLVRGDGTVPLWSIWLLRFQVGILYVYGGLAKLQGDWLSGQPVELWMSRRMHIPFVRFLVDRGWEVAFFSWGGVLFDLLIVPALLWRRTRAIAFVTMLAFHLINRELLNIGVFPAMMVAFTTIFLAPGWPRVLLRKMRVLGSGSPAAVAERGERTRGPISRIAFGAIVAYVVVQCLLPARSHLYPGNVLWREQAQGFSWRMMLREKTGTTSMRVATERGVDTVQLSAVLRPWQVRPVTTRPYLILQLAHFLADFYRSNSYSDVKVFADAMISLNGRDPQRLIDPDVDLAAQPVSILPAEWIVPLQVPRN